MRRSTKYGFVVILLFVFGIIGTVYIGSNPSPEVPPNANDLNIEANSERQVQASFNATDPDSGGELEYAIVSQPDHGSVNISGDSFTYISEEDYSGSDSFTYRVVDDEGEADTATVSVELENGQSQSSGTESRSTETVTTTSSNSDQRGVTSSDNRHPSAESVSILTHQGDVVVGSFDASDPDSGDLLTYSIESDPDHGIVITDGTEFTYTPDTGFTGSDSFIYQVSDGNGGTDTATVSITVTETVETPTSTATVDQEPPTAADVSFTTDVNDTVEGEFDASDPDGDSLTYSITSGHGCGSGSAGTVRSRARRRGIVST